MATPIVQAPPRVRAAAKRHAPDREAERAETVALLERHRAGESGIVLTAEELAAKLGVVDQDPPGAASAV
jgi:hypothetical protein